MTAIVYGRRFQCDNCLFQADGKPANMDKYPWGETPDGWTSLPDYAMQMLGPTGSLITHFCPDCSKLPIESIVKKVGICPKSS